MFLRSVAWKELYCIVLDPVFAVLSFYLIQRHPRVVFFFPLLSFYVFLCSLGNRGRWIMPNFICESPWLNMILQKKKGRIIHIGRGAKGRTCSIIKQYFHMAEWRGRSYHCSLMLFCKIHLHLKAYFKSGFLPARIFSKILDYTLDIEIIFSFIYTLIVFHLLMPAIVLWHKSKNILNFKEMLAKKTLKNWPFFTPATTRQEDELPQKDLCSSLAHGAVGKKRYKVAQVDRKAATQKRCYTEKICCSSTLGTPARLLYQNKIPPKPKTKPEKYMHLLLLFVLSKIVWTSWTDSYCFLACEISFWAPLL